VKVIITEISQEMILTYG